MWTLFWFNLIIGIINILISSLDNDGWPLINFILGSINIILAILLLVGLVF